MPIDRKAMTARLPWGPTIPLRPFFGILGGRAAPGIRAVSSVEPREFGGNMDNKEFLAGTSLFLPVFVPGANFSVGDGHAVQGDGEVCLTALETCLTGTFELVLHKGMTLDMPRAVTPTHYITMGLDPDLDDAAKQALRDMIRWLVEMKGWTPDRGVRVLQPRLRPARHAARRRQQGHPRDGCPQPGGLKMQLFDLKGKAAIVTGGNGGIGLGMARGLAQAGAAVVVAGRNAQKSAAAVKELEALGVKATAIEVDVTRRGLVPRAGRRGRSKQFGRLDILVNNAGINIRKQPQEYALAEWREVHGHQPHQRLPLLAGRLPGDEEGGRRQDHQHRLDDVDLRRRRSPPPTARARAASCR